MNKIIANINGKDKVISVLDSKKLHKFIIKNVSQELADLVQDCHYPSFITIYKELLHQTNSNEKDLIKYSKQKYGNPQYKLLHDPKTTLLLLIIQDFLSNNDIAGAASAFHLLSIRKYSNAMHKFIKYCNEDFFRSALSNISHNHLFITKKTIGSSIVYLSNTLFRKYKGDLESDNMDRIYKLIMEIHHRFNQSVKAFARQYYIAHANNQSHTSKEEDSHYEQNHEQNLKNLITPMVDNITTYKHIDKTAVDTSQKITKFNRKLSTPYIKALSNTKYNVKVPKAGKSESRKSTLEPIAVTALVIPLFHPPPVA
jgi:hypothetical protein